MAGLLDTAFIAARPGRASGFAVKLAPAWDLFRRAFETEAAQRRLFLWLPVTAGAGVVLYLYADREPSFWLVAPAAVSFGATAYAARRHRVAFYFFSGLCALFAGELSVPRGSPPQSSTG